MTEKWAILQEKKGSIAYYEKKEQWSSAWNFFPGYIIHEKKQRIVACAFQQVVKELHYTVIREAIKTKKNNTNVDEIEEESLKRYYRQKQDDQTTLLFHFPSSMFP